MVASLTNGCAYHNDIISSALALFGKGAIQKKKVYNITLN